MKRSTLISVFSSSLFLSACAHSGNHSGSHSSSFAIAGSSQRALTYTPAATLPKTKCGNKATQARPTYLDIPAKLRAVGSMKAGQKYPLVVWMPWTGGPSERYFEEAGSYLGLESYFAVLPQGLVQREHYLPDFVCFAQWFEQRLASDIEQIIKAHPSVDTSKIYMTGFSIGGDLGCALIVRKKELFKGAMLQGTRCSYGATKKDLEYLRDNKRRIVMISGNNEDPARTNGMVTAVRKFQASGVAVHHWIFSSSQSHYIAGRDDSVKAFRLMLQD